MLESKLMFESVFDALAHYNRQTINEGPLDALKKGAKAVGGAIKGAAKQVTTKVTAEKLNSAWKKAGSPTDSEEIYNIIKSLGVNDDVIKSTYDSMQIPVAAKADQEQGKEKTDAPDADLEPGAEKADTAPANTTAGDSGDQVDQKQPAATDTSDDLGKAKQNAAMRKGRGLSPEEEKQVEKDFTATKELEKQGVEKGSEISFTTKKGQEMKGTIVGPSEDGDENKLSIKDAKNKTYNVPKTSLKDKTGNPITSTTTTTSTSTTGGTGGGDSSTSTDTTTTTTTTDKSGTDDAGTPTSGTDKPTDNVQKAANTPGAPADFKQAAQAQQGGAGNRPIDIKALANDIKQRGPKVVDNVKKMLAA